nr:hypothetical protein [Tanacetum cinerariifolium]
ESEGIPDHRCDVPSHDKSPPLDVSKDQFEDFSESNEEFSSTDDDSFSLDNIDYVEASPPDSELVSSEVMNIVISEVGGIEASNDNPVPFYDPIIFGIPPNLTPSRESDFFLEVDAFLAVEDELISSQFPKLYLDPEGDMLLLESFLNDDHTFDFKTKSPSTSLNFLLEETNKFNNSLPEFTTFSKVLFDAEYESDSSDDQSCSDEDVLEKIVSKPLYEFTGELTLLKSIPPEIDEIDCDFEEDIRVIEKLLYDNSSPRPPEEFDLPSNNTLSFAEKESFYFDIPPFSRPPAKPPDGDTGILNIKMMGDIYDQKAFMHKLMITLASDQEKSHDLISHRTILPWMFFCSIFIPLDSLKYGGIWSSSKDLPSNNTLSFAEKESFYFDIPPFSRPPAKPPDGDTGILNIKMMGDIYDQKAFMHKLMITLASHQEKSPDLISYRCGTVKKFNTHRSHLNKCPMLIHEQKNPPLDVLLFHFYPP